jgi:hypothetical protein
VEGSYEYKNSCGQLTGGGPPGWELGWGLVILYHKRLTYHEILHRVQDLTISCEHDNGHSISIKGAECLDQPESGVEAGSNTSTVALRVVGSEEKGSLESETVKYGHESHGTRTRK